MWLRFWRKWIKGGQCILGKIECMIPVANFHWETCCFLFETIKKYSGLTESFKCSCKTLWCHSEVELWSFGYKSITLSFYPIRHLWKFVIMTVWFLELWPNTFVEKERKKDTNKERCLRGNKHKKELVRARMTSSRFWFQFFFHIHMITGNPCTSKQPTNSIIL